MAQQCTVGGVAYEIKGGRTLVNGVGYAITKGRTLVAGVGYDVSFAPAAALPTFDGSCNFYGTAEKGWVELLEDGTLTFPNTANLASCDVYLLENGKIETTVTRAKEVRSMAEKIITIGKNDSLHAKRQVYSFITKETVAKKVFDEISPKYKERNGGYTRIIKIGPRRGDAAEMAIIELV